MRLESYSEVEKIEEPVIYIYIYIVKTYFILFLCQTTSGNKSRTCAHSEVSLAGTVPSVGTNWTLFSFGTASVTGEFQVCPGSHDGHPASL